MKKFIITAIIVIISLQTLAQVQQIWAESHIAELRDQFVDANGNIYQVATAFSAAHNQPGTLTIKTNKNGNELWRHFWPSLDLATTMAVDAAGNVYYAGASTSNYTNAGDILEIGDNARIYIVKINANGIFQWSNIYFENDIGEPYQVYGYPRAMLIDENGNPCITGVIYNSLQSPQDSVTSDFATIKYDKNTGNRLWVKRFNGASPGSGFDEAKGIAIDAFGNIYVTGTSQLNGYMDVVTVKYNYLGNEVWVQRYSNPDPVLKNDYAVIDGVKLDAAGNVIVALASKAGEDISGVGGNGKRSILKYTFSGFLLWVRERTTLYFSNGPIVIDNAHNIIESSDGHTLKYSASGNLQWTYLQDFNAMVVDNENNIYSVRSCQRAGSEFCGDYFGYTTRKLNSNGVLRWEKTYNWSGTGRALIGIDEDENIYTAGSEWWIYLQSGYVTIRYSQCEIACPANMTVISPPGTCTADVIFPNATTTGYCGSAITYSHASGSAFPVGITTVTALSSETGAECSFTITVRDNEKPVFVQCPSGKSINNSPGLCYATSSAVNAAAPSATDNCSVLVHGTRSDGQPLNANYPIGITNITWTATDVSGNTATCTQNITVVDNEPPVINNETVTPIILSPPNHTMRNVHVSYTATDNCGLTTTLIVTSNEPINGVGDGDTDPDWIVLDNHNVQLRAERSAMGSGRIYTITIRAEDTYGNVTTKPVEVRVPHDIKSPRSGQPFVVNSTVNFMGEFWDKPGNQHTAKWILDGNTIVSGTVTEPTAHQNGKVTGSYKFNLPGVYKLQMNVTDQNGLINYSNTNGDLDATVVIYDPNGGYTYGGGWFPSPTGALVQQPSATGKGSFGFSVNYRNAAKPKGETQFEFKVGSFEFNALNFDYLVVSGYKAQFRGTGKIIGGQSGINFIMTVTDGRLDGTEVDKIRLKIFRNNGQVIYDNQPGASEADDPIQPVADNSIIYVEGNQERISNSQNKGIVQQAENEVNSFAVTAFPNPSDKHFTLVVKTKNQTENILMQVYDFAGREIQSENIKAGNVIQLGEKFKAGTYLVKLTQGSKVQAMKLVKL